MGRRLKLASPMNRAEIGSAATMPAMRRVVVPLFPQSSTSLGARSPRSPTPSTVMSGASGGMAAPRRRKTSAVDATSADSRMPVMRDVPSPNAARMSARCEMDLSPGTRRAP